MVNKRYYENEGLCLAWDLMKVCQVAPFITTYLSIDKSRVPCHGRYSSKQFIRAKPIKFGYKLWVVASATGSPYNVQYMQESQQMIATGEALGTRVVKNVLEVCEGQSNHNGFFNNFFSSYQLLSDLDKKGFRTTGTMRKDRVIKCPLIDMKQMKRKERRLYDYRSDGKIEIVWWNDNSVVTLGSNTYSVKPVGTIKRWVKGIGKSNMNQPAVIAAYSQGWEDLTYSITLCLT